MGNLTNNHCYGKQRDSGTVDALEQLRRIILNDYENVKAAYNALPSQEAKEQFLSIFENFGEEDLMMGKFSVNMQLELIDGDEEAQEKLTQLETLIQQYQGEEQEV